LAYGRTIHKFQGQTAGPVEPDKIKNMYEVIICNPDEHKWEGQFMGLFYTALLHATTLGDDNGLNLAIYFSGIHFKEDQIRNLGKKCRSTDDFENIVKQTKWIEHLKKHTKPITDLSQRHINTLSWAENMTFDDHQLYHRIKQHVLSNRHRSSDDYCK
jgi:hypothetical protein